nr:15565_t:CDS:2 [Entrophospora candida]
MSNFSLFDTFSCELERSWSFFTQDIAIEKDMADSTSATLMTSTTKTADATTTNAVDATIITITIAAAATTSTDANIIRSGT